MKLLTYWENNKTYKELQNLSKKARKNPVMRDKMIQLSLGAAEPKFKKQNEQLKSMKRWWKPNKIDPLKNLKIMISREAPISLRLNLSRVNLRGSLERKPKIQDLCQGLRWGKNQRRPKVIKLVGHKLLHEDRKKKPKNQGRLYSRTANQRIQQDQSLNSRNRKPSADLDQTTQLELLNQNHKQLRPMQGSKRAKISGKSD